MDTYQNHILFIKTQGFAASQLCRDFSTVLFNCIDQEIATTRAGGYVLTSFTGVMLTSSCFNRKSSVILQQK